MAKNDKKILKLQERIVELENEMQISLHKKSSSKIAFDVPNCMKKISDLRMDIKKLQ